MTRHFVRHARSFEGLFLSPEIANGSGFNIAYPRNTTRMHQLKVVELCAGNGGTRNARVGFRRQHLDTFIITHWQPKQWIFGSDFGAVTFYMPPGSGHHFWGRPAGPIWGATETSNFGALCSHPGDQICAQIRE